MAADMRTPDASVEKLRRERLLRSSVYRRLLERPQLYRGLGLLALTSALLIPLSLELIFSHRDQWFIGHERWQDEVLPWAWRGHTLLFTVLLSGWSADRALFFTSTLPARARLAAFIGLSGALCSAFFAIPGWVWLARLDLISGGEASLAALLDFIPLMSAGVLSGLLGHRFPPPLAALISICFTAILISVMWGWLS